ncbi:MAG: RND transporter [Desulfobacteraceae bacterium]|nr:RND transporter [Desulfobacteraceae bacterium]
MVLKWLDALSYPILIVVAVLMLLAPFRPVPHVWEKLQMLKAGQLSRPIDIFDLIFHLSPTLLLIAKVVRSAFK